MTTVGVIKTDGGGELVVPDFPSTTEHSDDWAARVVVEGFNTE